MKTTTYTDAGYNAYATAQITNTIGDTTVTAPAELYQFNTRDSDGYFFCTKHDIGTCIRLATEYVASGVYNQISINPVGEVGSDTALYLYTRRDGVEINAVGI